MLPNFMSNKAIFKVLWTVKKVRGRIPAGQVSLQSYSLYVI